MMRPTLRGRTSVLRAEDGAFTILGLFIFVTILVVAGLAVDVSNAYRVRTQLQVAGDATAHAALVAREFNGPSTAKNVALAVASANLPSGSYDASLREEDIIFGRWDSATETFSPDANAFQAVLVNTGRAHDRSNSLSTYLLKFAGIGALDVRRQTVFETYRPTCLREGFVGEDIVEVTSNNSYWNGFCVHSNTYVELNNGNYFDSGTIVSMPDVRDLVIPTDGFDSNVGLASALRDGSYVLRIVNRVDDIIAGVRDPNSIYYRDYISNDVEIAYNKKSKLDQNSFQPGRIHTITCAKDTDQVKIPAGSVLRETVIWTNCTIMFGQGVVLEDTVIANESTAADSFNAASGVEIGRNDHCAVGGGAQLVTRGGIDIPAQLQMYGGQMIAVGDISFTAEASGIEGASIISGGRIDGTSNSDMAFCGGFGMEDNFEAEYFRLAF